MVKYAALISALAFAGSAAAGAGGAAYNAVDGQNTQTEQKALRKKQEFEQQQAAMEAKNRERDQARSKIETQNRDRQRLAQGISATGNRGGTLLTGPQGTAADILTGTVFGGKQLTGE